MSEATQPLVYRCTVCHAVYSAGERFCPLDAAPIKPEDQHSDPRIGRTIDGRYFVRRLIGRGGMGAVYEADHVGLDKRVAIKFLAVNNTDRDGLARFRREAKIASRIVHEHVVHIYDVGTADADTDFIVMEFLEGQDLAVTLRESGALDAARTVSIIRKVLRGLRAIHQAGIVHRDIKPANILISPREEDRDFVKIMDFGISKPIQGETITSTGVIIGTPEYMSPEQLLGDDIDQRADLYAVGIMMYRMLADRLPFTTERTFDRAAAASPYVPVPSLAGARPDLARDIVVAVERATAKDRDERFPDAQAFLTALETIATPSHAVPRRESTAKTVSARMNAFGAADTAIADTQAQQTPSLAPPQHNWLPVTNQTNRTNEPLAAQAVPTVREAAPPRRRTGLIVGLGLLAVGAVVTTILVLGRSGTEKIVLEQPVAPTTPPASAPAGGPPSVAPSDKDKLTGHLQAAREAEAKNKLDDALAAYQAAYTIDPSVETTYALAELHQRLGHTADAIRYFERYLMNAAKDAPNRDSVAKRIAQLEGSSKPAATVARHPAPAMPAGTGTASGSAALGKGLRECHCVPKDRRDTVSMCAKKGPSRCRCQNSNNNKLCPMQVTKCPDTCPDGSDSCKKFCSSSGFECADRDYDKQRKPGVHGTPCTGFVDWDIRGEETGKLDCDHCDDAPQPRQFRGHDGEACIGYYRSTGEKLDGILSCPEPR